MVPQATKNGTIGTGVIVAGTPSVAQRMTAAQGLPDVESVIDMAARGRDDADAISGI